MDESPTYVNTDEASRITHVPAPTLRHYRHRNVGPPSVKIGRRVLYRLDDLHAWLKQQENQSRRGDIIN